MKINQKGQSLIEVTVALSILAVVMISVVTITVDTISLMLDSRDKTEAIGFAQKYLEDKKGSKSNTCNGFDKSLLPITETKTDAGKYTTVIKLTNSGVFPDAIMITVTTSWKAKNNTDREVIVKQLINSKQ